MDLEDRQRICRLVAGVMFSDGHFAEEERAFLERICVRFGLARDAYEELTPLDTGACSAALRELPEKVQAKVLALLVEATVADGVVEAQERAYLLVAAAALEVDAVVMEQRIARRMQQLDVQGPMSDPGADGPPA
ncbi:MAG: hypothetical protein R3B72_04185 [Polyangiaceae bacterium]